MVIKLVFQDRIGGKENMKSDGKCMWIYYDGKCECSECEKCSHYKPDFKEKNGISYVNSRRTISEM